MSSSPLVHPASFVVNDGAYWDNYVREWEKDPERAGLSCVGREWGGEEIFVAMVQRLANPDDTALEIGCGGGRVTAQVHDRFQRVIAADVSEGMLSKCHEMLAGRNVDFHTIDGFTLQPLDNDTLQFVYSHDVFVHFSSLQVYSYLHEIRRVLVPGGRAVLSFYNFPRHFDLFREMSLSYQRDRMLPPHMRVHFLTEDMLRIMLADVGFDLIDIDTQNFLCAAFEKPNS